jgi:uncharacterized membrane protein YedE/YeeE
VSAGHWPWWLGAAGLAGVTVGSCLAGRRPFGVSGIVGRLVDWRRELAAERARHAMASADEAALEAALAAATAEAFAGMTPAPEPVDRASSPVVPPPSGPAAPPVGGAAGRPTLSAHATFLVAIVAGAALASALRGGFEPTLALPAAYARLVAPGGWGLLGLGAGGLLVGVGTTISGGCSTGHGLTGCARLQPAGLAATATFFGVAVAVSLLLAGRLG